MSRGAPIRSWSGEYTCAPRAAHHPRSSGEVAAILRAAGRRGGRVRPVGAALSPSDIALSDDEVVWLDRLASVLEIDRDAERVRVQPGVPLHALAEVLTAHGLALPNLGSIALQTVAGATATATHGTGRRFGVLSTMIEALEIATPGGELLRASATEEPEVFQAARVGLGALGVITELTLRVVPAFDLEVEERSRELEDVVERLPENLRSDHYRFWLLPHVGRVWEWRAKRVPPRLRRGTPPSLRDRLHAARERLVGYHAFEAMLYLGTRMPALIPPTNRLYARSMLSSPRTASGPSSAMFTFDCLFKQRVDEWAIPIERTAEAVGRLEGMITDRGFRAHLPIEVRFVGRDDIWLSPCFERDSCYIGIITYMPYGRDTDTGAYFTAFEELMLELGGRPHWAKRFGPDARTLRTRYPRWDDFQRVRARLDPRGVMSNRYTDRVLGPVAPERARRAS